MNNSGSQPPPLPRAYREPPIIYINQAPKPRMSWFTGCMAVILGTLGACFVGWKLMEYSSPVPRSANPVAVDPPGTNLIQAFIDALEIPSIKTNADGSNQFLGQVDELVAKLRAPLETGTFEFDYHTVPAHVVGSVTNRSSRTYSFVMVEFNLYDSSGARVGSSSDSIQNLEASGVWHYRAPIYGENVAKVSLLGVWGN